MIWEFKSKAIVMLCNMMEDNQETSYPYWPTKEEETIKYGKIVVTMQSKAAYGDFGVRKFNLREDKVCLCQYSTLNFKLKHTYPVFNLACIVIEQLDDSDSKNTSNHRDKISPQKPHPPNCSSLESMQHSIIAV